MVFERGGKNVGSQPPTSESVVPVRTTFYLVLRVTAPRVFMLNEWCRSRCQPQLATVFSHVVGEVN